MPDPDDQSNLSGTLHLLDEALLHMQQAAELLTQGRSFEALRLAEKAASTLPKTPGMHFLRSICLKAMNRHSDALKAANAELEVNPDHPESIELVRELTEILRSRFKPVGAPIPTAKRPWHTELSRESLLSIQDAIGDYTYRGVPLIKNPFDFALYSRLFWALKPRTIIEIGSNAGGSALWFGDLLNNFGIEGHVYSIDLIKVTGITHPRVTFIEGDGRKLLGV
ncbi:MAG: CmcI family methyltransferase, partial [Verrucomicrobia bacterium]|nr:CmcI family methyltransferase [Verrucomicrobiota bacterium]